MGDDARLGFSSDPYVVDEVHAHEGLDRGLGVRRCDDDVDVADGLREATQRSAERRVGDARNFEQTRHDPRRQRQRDRDGRPARPTLFGEPIERVRDLVLGLLAESLELAELSTGHRVRRSSTD